jgi:hypothetical protein
MSVLFLTMDFSRYVSQKPNRSFECLSCSVLRFRPAKRALLAVEMNHCREVLLLRQQI